MGSGIPTSATTVQGLTNDERSTDKTKRRMNEYEGSLKRVFEAESADIAFRLQDVDTSKVINHEDEDPEFYCEFTRVIDDVTRRSGRRQTRRSRAYS